eukprot:6190213-Pleurochrysis_carterae.AAC.1
MTQLRMRTSPGPPNITRKWYRNRAYLCSPDSASGNGQCIGYQEDNAPAQESVHTGIPKERNWTLTKCLSVV